MATYDLLDVEAGATYRRTFRYLQSDGTTPVPMTGWTAEIHFRAKVDATETIVEKTPTIDVPTGAIVLDLTPAETRLLPRSCVWGLELTAPGGDVIRLAQGKVKVSPEVVR
jgi:hypothetical protein